MQELRNLDSTENFINELNSNNFSLEEINQQGGKKKSNKSKKGYKKGSKKGSKKSSKKYSKVARMIELEQVGGKKKII